jgi:membrane fusion protein, multidrug efflux system
MSNIKPQYWALVIISLIVLWIGSGLLSNANETQKQLIISEDDSSLNEILPSVRYEIMTSRNYYSDFKILATTKAENKIEIKSETDGIISSIPYAKGTFVEKDSIICELQINDRQELLNSAESKLEEAEISYSSSAKLVKNGYAPENQLISKKVDLERTKAEFKKAQIELNRIKIKAPFDGIINDIKPKVGEFITKGNTCAKLIDSNPMLITGYISEINIDKITIGTPVNIKLITNDILKGKINFISSSAEPNTRTFLVEAIVDNKNYKIKDGITAEIIITVKSELAHKFSPSILSLNDKGVMGIKTINNDNLVEFYPVDIINLDDSGAVAINLPKILKVITVGQDYVNVGQKVDPIQYNIEKNE